MAIILPDRKPVTSAMQSILGGYQTGVENAKSVTQIQLALREQALREAESQQRIKESMTRDMVLNENLATMRLTRQRMQATQAKEIENRLTELQSEREELEAERKVYPDENATSMPIPSMTLGGGVGGNMLMDVLGINSTLPASTVYKTGAEQRHAMAHRKSAADEKKAQIDANTSELANKEANERFKVLQATSANLIKMSNNALAIQDAAVKDLQVQEDLRQYGEALTDIGNATTEDGAKAIQASLIEAFNKAGRTNLARRVAAIPVKSEFAQRHEEVLDAIASFKEEGTEEANGYADFLITAHLRAAGIEQDDPSSYLNAKTLDSAYESQYDRERRNINNMAKFKITDNNITTNTRIRNKRTVTQYK